MNALIQHKPAQSLLRMSALAAALALGLSACQKTEDNAAVTPAPAPASVATTPAPTTMPAAPAPMTSADSPAQPTTSAGTTGSSAGEAMSQAGSDAKSAVQSAGSAVGQAVDDASVTAMVKTQLARDPDISALAINVDTKDGAVTLNGTAPSSTAKARAEEIAKGVDGVKSVSNNLDVKAS